MGGKAVFALGRSALAICLFAVAVPRAAGAQMRTRGGPPPGPESPAARERIEQRLREGLWLVAKERLGLTGEQMARLQAVTLKSDLRRRSINGDDRAQRQLLRAELLAGDAANQDRVAAALDRLLQLHRARLDLFVDEQHELAEFLTPVQRARYAALQDELRHRADALRRERRVPHPI